MLKSIIKIFSSSMLGAFFAFLVQVINANNMSVSDYGILSSSLALCAMLIPLVGLGFEQYIYKYSAENNFLIEPLIYPVIKYFFITCILSFAIFFTLNSNKDTYLLVVILISQFLLNILLCVYQINGNYNKYSLVSLLQGLSRISCISIGIYFFGFYRVLDISLMYFLSSTITMVICLAILLNFYCFSKSDKNVTLRELVVCSVPFGVGTLSHIVYSQSNVFLLEKFDSSFSAGLYSAAYLFLIVAYLVPTIIFQRYLIPKLHIWMSNGDDLKELYRAGNTVLLILGVSVSILFYLLSDILVDIIFGKGYEEAANILSLLSISILCRYFSSNSASYLFTNNYINVKNKMMLFTMTINVVLSIFFINKFGLYGAVYSTLISEITIATLYVVYVKQNIFCELSISNMLSIKKEDFYFLFKVK